MGCLSVFKAWWKTVFDIITSIVLLAAFVGIYVARHAGYIVHRGFYCDDTSIRFPAKESTISTSVLVVVSIMLVLIVLIGGNVWERFVSHKCKPGKPFHPCGSDSQSCLIPHWIVRICYEFRWFAVGFLINVVVTEAGKIVSGRLRPNFLSVCNPDFSQINCTDQFGHPLYVADYMCRGDESDINDSRVSWPSGHSSLSAYSFLFLALYVSCVRSFYSRSAFKLTLMLFSFMLALLTGVSRFTDNKHHPTDILSGWIIGAVVAFIVVYYNLAYFGELKRGSDTKKSHNYPAVRINSDKTDSSDGSEDDKVPR